MMHPKGNGLRRISLHMMEEYLRIVARICIEVFFNIIGFLNIKALLFRKSCNVKRVAFQGYSIHLAQFYKTIIEEFLNDHEEIQIQFIILLHPHFSLRSSYKMKNYIYEELHIPLENIKFYWQVIWEQFDIIIYNDVYAKFPLRRARQILLMHGPGLRRRVFEKIYFANQ